MILVVDDDPDIRFILNKQLTREGYSVDTAVNGQEALKKLNSNPDNYDLIILDLMMPVMDGNEFMKLLETSNIEVPIIILSAYIDRIRDDLKSIPKEVLSKPFPGNQLITEIKKFV